MTSTRGEKASSSGCRIFVKELVRGGLHQFRPHEQYENRHQKPGYVFDPSMAEGMIRVWLLSGHLKTDQGDDRRTGVREIVEGISRDGDGAGQESCGKFACKEADI